MVRTPHFNCRGRGFDPWLGTKIPHVLQHGHNYWKSQLPSLSAVTTEAHVPRACALHQEKPPQSGACEPLATVRESLGKATKTSTSKKKKKKDDEITGFG